MDDWLLSSMADNDNLEWIDVLTGDVLAGDGSVQRSQPAHVARSTASWRVPNLSVPSVCDWAVGVRVLVRGCSLCRVRDPVRVAWCGCGARVA